MYKCGWNGCEKAYGTLNHLNAHVTMQSHGAKRTPEGMFLFLLGGGGNFSWGHCCDFLSSISLCFERGRGYLI